MTDLLRVEFHCHTIYSKDSLTRVEDLLARCAERGIDRLVITDHNTIAGALAAKAIDPVRVIVGEEIMTREGGELLGAFMIEEVPKDLPALEVIERLRGQGAFISVSHPFDFMRGGGWRLANLERIASLVDAVEVFNARCLFKSYNKKAAGFAKKHGLLGTAGSDAHSLREVGQAVMTIPAFEDAESFKESLAEVYIEGRLSGLGVRVDSRWAVLRKKIGRNGEMN